MAVQDTIPSALLPTANFDLCYSDDKKEDILKSLLSGGHHLLYGPGGSGKTWTGMSIAGLAQARGYRVTTVALANEAALRFQGKGIYNAFGLVVDRQTKKPKSKLDALCLACRRSNPDREADPLWDRQLPTIDEEKDYAYMKRYTLYNKNLSTMTDPDIIASINRYTSKYKQLDCATAFYDMQSDFFFFEECFMIGCDLMKLLDTLLRKYRRCDKPFGGAGILLSGDALQVEPIQQSYLFQSHVWNDLSPIVHLFGESRRFDQDPFFLEFLRSARLGVITDEHHQFLVSRRRSNVTAKSMYSLCRTREETDNKNKAEFDKLKSTRYVVRAQDQYFHVRSDKTRELLDDNLAAEAKRTLTSSSLATELQERARVAVGARIIITHNNRETSVFNGHTGVVTQVNYRQYPEHERTDGRAGTIDSVCVLFDHPVEHKRTEIPGKRTIQPGDTLTFPSRTCKVLSVSVDSFTSMDTVEIGKITVEYSKGSYLMTRTQFPFSLGWARTIHKAQGSTVDGGVLVLSGRMSAGQAYVGISRYRSREDLVVEDNYDRKVFYANRFALEFDRVIQETGKWVVNADAAPSQEGDGEAHNSIDDDIEADEELRRFLSS